MNLTDEEIDNTIACWNPADGHTDKILLQLHRYAVELKETRAELHKMKSSLPPRGISTTRSEPTLSMYQDVVEELVKARADIATLQDQLAHAAREQVAREALKP